jgi:hypothetical protein
MPHRAATPTARQGLVEVVKVEEQGPLGRGEAAEVEEEGVAAELRREAAVRRSGQVRRHTAAAPR